MDVGSPWQSIRVLPSTSGNAIWPVLTEGCTPQDPLDCGERRGSIFKPNESTTWTQIGLYELVIPEEDALDYSGNSSFGIDNVKFGFPKDDLPSVTHQVVEGIATKDFYLGVVGLSPNAINITSYNDPNASLLTNLKDQDKIPSRSWAYTAGAAYRQPMAYGSLTLGGYDKSRFAPNNLSVSFSQDDIRDLQVGLQHISVNEMAVPLPSNSIYVFLDSLVPDLWLPVPACHTFETMYGLEYNSSLDRYFINETMHSQLIAHNPNVTFTIGQEATGGETINITMQYGSFDLVYKGKHDIGDGSRYFPLRRAQNYTQFTLGRAFFQDAYVVADYERGNFSVSQVVFPNASTSPDIVPIYPPSEEKQIVRHNPLSTGAIVGVVIAFIVLLTLVTVTWWWFKKRAARDKAGKIMVERNQQSKESVPAYRAVIWDGKQHEASADAEAEIPELLGWKINELRTVHNNGHELPTGFSINELPADRSERQSRISKRK